MLFDKNGPNAPVVYTPRHIPRAVQAYTAAAIVPHHALYLDRLGGGNRGSNGVAAVLLGSAGLVATSTGTMQLAPLTGMQTKVAQADEFISLMTAAGA